jgi:hypothetical protein
MTPEKFTQLTKKLDIHGINLMSHEVNIRDDYVPSNVNKIEGIQQSFSGIAGVFKGESEIIYRFKAGVRVMSSDAPEEALKGADEGYRILEIKADFNAVYGFSGELTEDEVQYFSKYNVMYNVWPYWREFVQNTCYRMNVPALKIPFLCRGTQGEGEKSPE